MPNIIHKINRELLSPFYRVARKLADGYESHYRRNQDEDPPYNQDGLKSIHNHEFMRDPAFQKAYNRGVKAAGCDYHWHWRAHVGLWVAQCASELEGDFVECGVNYGVLSSAIMEYLNWDSLGKQFYLLDTFKGLDERFISTQDKTKDMMKHSERALESGFYVKGSDLVRANFSEWKNVTIIEGSVPETLSQVAAKKIAYLHLDMNCSPPEIAAAEFFWDRMVPGAFVLMDDYTFAGCRSQKIALDDFAASKRLRIVSLPTGQGILIRPPSGLGRQ